MRTTKQSTRKLTVFIPVQRHGERSVIEAKKAELANWEATEAVDLIEDISTRWVITESSRFKL